MIAGGSCLVEAQMSQGIKSTYNDIDIFVDTQELFEKVSEVLRGQGRHFESKHALNFTLYDSPEQDFSSVDDPFDDLPAETSAEFQVQVIKPRRKSYQNIIDNFDLNNSKYWTFWPYDVIESDQPEETLTVISPAFKKYNALFRIMKYVRQKNMTLPNSESFNRYLWDLCFEPKKEYEGESFYETQFESEEYLEGLIGKTIYVCVKEKHSFIDYVRERQHLIMDRFEKIVESFKLDNTYLAQADILIIDYYLCQMAIEQETYFVQTQIPHRYRDRTYQKHVYRKMAEKFPALLL
jgi:hypothetical protein